MMEHGQYLARRGMINVSLPMTAQEIDGLVVQVEEFLDRNARILGDLYQRPSSLTDVCPGARAD
jgi:hypothetical protein